MIQTGKKNDNSAPLHIVVVLTVRMCFGKTVFANVFRLINFWWHQSKLVLFISLGENPWPTGDTS